MTQSSRIYYLDVIRVLACLMVVMMHAPVPGGGLSGSVIVPISMATAPCIGLFYMVSGALLLPTKERGIVFVKKRLGKVVWPILFWTLVAIVINGFTIGWMSVPEMMRTILSIPFSVQGHGVMWFMYVLVGLYLAAPVISPWIERASRKELLFYLVLWGITLCYPILKLVLDINDSETGILYYFCGYIGYFLLGYYLNRYGIGKSWFALLLLPIPFIVYGIFYAIGNKLNIYEMFWYLSIFCAMMCYSWFTIIRNSSNWIDSWRDDARRFLVLFSNCTFGIYLMHIFVMRNFLWDTCHIANLGGFLSFAVSFGGTLLISLVLTILISHLPGAENIIGYKAKKVK